jgi:hypothetical protein
VYHFGTSQPLGAKVDSPMVLLIRFYFDEYPIFSVSYGRTSGFTITAITPNLFNTVECIQY